MAAGGCSTTISTCFSTWPSVAPRRGGRTAPSAFPRRCWLTTSALPRLDPPRDGRYVSGFWQVHTSELVLGGQLQLFVAERRPGAGQDIRGAWFAAAGTCPEPGIADIEAEDCAASPGVDPEKGIGEWVCAHVEARGTQHGNRVHLANERVVGNADPPPDGLAYLLRRVALPGNVFPDLAGGVAEKCPARRVITAESGQILKGGNAAERLQREVHDVGEGEIGPPVDDGLDGHCRVLADVAERVLAGRADGLYLGRFQLVEDTGGMCQDGAGYLRASRVLAPLPQQRLRPHGDRESGDDLVRGRVHDHKVSAETGIISAWEVQWQPTLRREARYSKRCWSGSPSLTKRPGTRSRASRPAGAART